MMRCPLIGGGKRLKYLFLLAIVSTASVLLVTHRNGTTTRISSASHTLDDPTDTQFTIRTEGCTIPELQPHDPRIMEFVQNTSLPEPCPNDTVSLLSSNHSHIWINRDHIEYYRTVYSLPMEKSISCCYTAFIRPVYVSNIRSSYVDDRVQYKECAIFNNYIEASDEFVRVNCSSGDKAIHQQFFLFATKKPFKSNYNVLPIQNKPSVYNVIVMGIDAVSRLNFHRTMAKTLKYLKSRGAIEMLGYNKVDDNTFPNMIPMLLGVRDTDLNKTCWPNSYRTFDNCPFVWESFKAQGFYTAFAEDSKILATFNYKKNGFIGSPTDYYLYTFINEAEKNTGKNRDTSCYLCMGGKYFYRVLLDYIDSLTTTLQSSKLFGFFWEVSMTHDFLNYPMAMDDAYATFLNNLESKGYLDDTILIVLSDHGARWGDIVKTKQGHLESRLPLLLVLTPPSFRKRYTRAYENLNTNGRRLITPFDIHETLADLSNQRSLTDTEIQSRTNSSYSKNLGISLFLPVPATRTCRMAGIDDHWCTCHSGVRLPMDSRDAGEAATNMVIQLNELIRKHVECAELTLDEVISVTEMAVGETEEVEVGWREFLVELKTMPGGGVFEGTLRSRTVAGGSSWKLAGSIGRLNLYGEQSHCVHDFRLKLYCYCQNQRA